MKRVREKEKTRKEKIKKIIFYKKTQSADHMKCHIREEDEKERKFLPKLSQESMKIIIPIKVKLIFGDTF